MKTGRGHHLWLKPSKPIRSQRVGGVEVKCLGAYIVAPPSIHPSGSPYVFETAPNGAVPEVDLEELFGIGQVDSLPSNRSYESIRHAAPSDFARVGIIALVDETTGYQVVRDRYELHKILEAYIAKEFLPWAKRFPDEFYEQLFRLRGWTYSPLSVSRPKYVGKLTNEIVYDKLPHTYFTLLLQDIASHIGYIRHC